MKPCQQKAHNRKEDVHTSTMYMYVGMELKLDPYSENTTKSVHIHVDLDFTTIKC